MRHKFIQVAGRKIGWNFAPIVIAEIGINHNGSIQLAKEMAQAAIDAGAEIIKHQTHIPEEEMSAEAHQVIPGNSTDSIYDIMARCALCEQEERELKEFVESQGSIFISTPFSFAAVDRLEKFSVPAYKIGSGEMNNLPLVDYIASLRKPIFLSTGMNHLDSVKRTVEVITRYHDQFVLLHTTNVYPTPANLIRLGALEELKAAFPGEIIGLSDHSLNNLACLAATALGASVLERHFTDRKDRPGEDICCSMAPAECTALIKESAEIAQMRGGSKKAAAEEEITIQFAFASVVAKRDITAGVPLQVDDLTTKRPAGGIAAAELNNIIGRKTQRTIKKGTQLKWTDLQ